MVLFSEGTAYAGVIFSSWLVPLYGVSPLLLLPNTACLALGPPDKVTGSLMSCGGVTRQDLGERSCSSALWPAFWRRDAFYLQQLNMFIC